MPVPSSERVPPELLGPILKAADDGGVGVVILALDATPPETVFVGRSAATLLGYDVSEAMAISPWQHVASESVAYVEQRLREVAGTGLTGSAELTLLHRDGHRVPAAITTAPATLAGRPAVVAIIRDASSGSPSGALARDTAERQEMHGKLIQADRLAAVGTLAAGIAHEINNPLAFMLLGLQYLERELPRLLREPERLNELLARVAEVRTGAERVGNIVRDLKTFARADEIGRGPVDPRAVLEAALKIAENELRHCATVVRRYEDEAPIVHGNAARLEQVFLNLLVNAAHALGDRDPATSEVQVSIRRGESRTVVVEVRDNGAGIAPEVMPRVFDPFFTTKPIGVGTGLGLPICRSIVTSFGGRLELESQPGSHTVARVVLPELEREADQSHTEPPPPAPSVPPTDRPRVLIVDDEPNVGSVLGRMLSPTHDVVVATSGAEALERVDEGDFDAIVCDVMMPGMTGMDVYASVRDRHPELARRIVFITGGAFVPRVASFLSTLDNPRLEKPFGVRVLKRALALVIPEDAAAQPG